MQEIQKIVNAKVQSMVEDGSIQKVVEQGVEKAIEKALNDQFRVYGGISKQLDEALKNGLQINIKDLPFETYNQQMLAAIKQRLGSMFHGAATERFRDEMDKLLAPAPKEMSVKALVEAIVALWKSDEAWGNDDFDAEASVELESHSYGGYTLEMWKERDSRYGGANRPDVQLYITGGGDQEEGMTIRINHKHRYNPTCFSSAEALVFKLYAAGTVITGLSEFDVFECDLTLKEDDY